MATRIVLDKAARVPPTTTPFFQRPRWLPLPSPFKGDRGATASAVISNQVDIGILVQVGVGVELPSDEVLDFPWSGCTNVGKSGDLIVCRRGLVVSRAGRLACGLRLRLAHHEGEGEYQLVVVVEFKEERGRAVGAVGRIRVLGVAVSFTALRSGPPHAD